MIRTWRFLPVLIVLLAIVSASAVAAQGQRLVPLDHWAYEYIHRLQLRGHLLDLHPTALPYTFGEVAAAVSATPRRRLSATAREWLDLLDDTFSTFERRVVIGGAVQPGMRASSTTRLDPLRPAPGDEGHITAASLNLYPHTALRAFVEFGPVVAQAGLRHDLYYRDDPDGLDAANRLITRNEDAYAGVGTRFMAAYIGRFQHQWAPYGQTALLMSRNAVGIDHLHLRVGGDRIALRSVVGELDSITDDGRFTGTAGADSVGLSVRRFVSAHRFDWRPSRHLALTLMESTVYSGHGTGLSLKFLNPLALHAFAVDGRPKNDENNGLLAGMLWAQAGAWTLQGELLIDDVDVMNTSDEPPALALSGHLTYAGIASTEIGASLTAVTSRTYNTHQPAGRYTHLNRGLGEAFNDFVHAGLHSTFFLGRGGFDVALTPGVDILFQGAAEIHMPYPSAEQDADVILDGTVQRVLRPAIEVRLQQGRTWWLNVDAGPAIIANEDHVEGSNRTTFTLTASLVARLDVRRRVRLSF